MGGQAAQPSEDPQTTAPSGQRSDQTLHEWVASANTAQGWTDHREASSLSVTVGSHALPYAFQPALARIAPGTTVTWEWAGYGGEHNVVATDGAFDSGSPVSGEDHTFEYTFEEVGTHRYVSEPRRDSGMKGIIAVEEVPTSGYPEVDSWLSDVQAYDGTIVTDATTVTVGETADSDHAFDPLALKVSKGTTVSWTWVEGGGKHSVAFESTDVTSTDLHGEAGTHLEYTFDSEGVYRYYCAPHRRVGEKGAVIVE